MSRVPTGISLEAWVRQLEAEGKTYRFYQSDEWQRLRKSILEEQHYECEWCRERGAYNRAVTVHHVKEVRDDPRWALSRYYIDEHGVPQKNLIALCNRCHNEAHHRFKGGAKDAGVKPKQPEEPPAPLTEERW